MQWMRRSLEYVIVPICHPTPTFDSLHRKSEDSAKMKLCTLSVRRNFHIIFRSACVLMEHGKGKRHVAVRPGLSSTFYSINGSFIFLAGKAVATNVNKIEAFKCGETHDPIITLDINQTDETQFPLPTNSFHFTRVGPETNVSVAVSGSNCYRWIITFEKKIEIAFLLLDINTPNLKGQNDTPLITVDINHRLGVPQKF